MANVKHINHVEDLIFFGPAMALDAFWALTSDRYYVKYDGAPAIVFGICPKTDCFFLSSKSYFNKVPKINYNLEDFEANHRARSPGLADKLQKIFPDVKEFYKNYKSPYKKDHIFQADLLFHNGIKENQFKPNTITYKLIEANTKYKMGLALHTRYDKRTGKLYGRQT